MPDIDYYTDASGDGREPYYDPVATQRARSQPPPPSRAFDYSQSPYGGGEGYRWEGPSPLYGGARPGATAGAADWASESDVRGYLENYFRERNMPPAPSIDYWLGKWNEWYPNREEEYFRSRGGVQPYFISRLPRYVGDVGDGPAPGTQFSDPASRQLEEYLTQQKGWLDQQRAAQEQANVGLRQRQGEAQVSAGRLTQFMQERAGRLQGPAYTGPEQEILRTQQLEPLERDRQAARRRALQNISARGFDPESGIAQELLNQVDRGFDEQRAHAQGELGYRQIMEQRSREQEAQALLAQIPQLQQAGARGDLDFLQALDAAVNRPAEAQLPLSMLQYQMPQNALQQALAAMGMAPSQNALFNQAMGLYDIEQQRRQQRGPAGYGIGSALGYLFPGAF